jgi:hypothetical protein
MKHWLFKFKPLSDLMIAMTIAMTIAIAVFGLHALLTSRIHGVLSVGQTGVPARTTIVLSGRAPVVRVPLVDDAWLCSFSFDRPAYIVSCRPAGAIDNEVDMRLICKTERDERVLTLSSTGYEESLFLSCEN